MERSWIKAECLGEIHFGRISLRPLARTLDIILYITLQRTMSQKSFMVVGLDFLGMRKIVVLFTWGGNWLVSSHETLELKSSDPQRYQNFFKKVGFKPVGHVYLSESISKSVDLNSSIEKDTKRESLSLAETHGEILLMIWRQLLKLFLALNKTSK